MVPRIKESRGNPGPPPCGVLLEGEAHGGPIFQKTLNAKVRESTPPGAFDVGETHHARWNGAFAPVIWDPTVRRFYPSFAPIRGQILFPPSRFHFPISLPLRLCISWGEVFS